MDATEFFTCLFGEAVGQDALISVWTLPDKDTQFFDDCEKAAGYAMSRADDSDVYFGVGLYRSGITRGRGKATDVVAITTLWADIDFGPEHAKPGIPKNEQDAWNIINRIGVKPSIRVHSGHGYHAYWLLTEEVPVSAGAAALAAKWSATVRSCAHCLGFEVDSVGDLSRVLRVPGTINRKRKKKPVTVKAATRSAPSLRYDEDELAGWCVESSYDLTDESAVTGVSVLHISPNADPPSNKLTGLIQNDTRFKRTFTHSRPDLRDQSNSGYDLSLASIAFGAGWTDQEIANLIIAFRRRHGLDPKKACRRDYLQRTIGKVKSNRESEAAINELELIPSTTSTTKTDLPDQNRKMILDLISKAIGLPVDRWLQQGQEEATYSLILRDGTDIAIGRVDCVMSQAKFRHRVYEATRVVCQQVKSGRWDQVVAKLGEVVEVVENIEAGRVNRLSEWLRIYIEKYRTFGEDEWSSALLGSLPFYRVDCLHVSAPHLCDMVNMMMSEKMKRADLWPYFHAAGFKCVRVSARVETKKGKITICRKYWQDVMGIWGRAATDEIEASDPAESPQS